MAQYLLMIYQDETRVPDRDSKEWWDLVDDHRRFQARVSEGPNELLGSQVLEPTTMATTLRADTITDGPFAETKESLGGFYLLEAADLDQALAVASWCPAGLGCVEVRPVLDVS